MKAAVLFILLGTCFLPMNTIAECIKGDCANGQGTMTYPDGSKYEGQWKDDKRNGQGTMSFPDGGRLAGQWKDGNFSGQGTMTYRYGTYEGQWKDGMKSGQGVMTYPDGSKYEGNWKEDKINGQGSYAYADGGKYVGEWQDGSKNGQGTYISPDSHTYVGHFKDGRPDGQGIMTFPDGSKHEVKWKDGKLVKDLESYGGLKPGQEKIAKSSYTEPKVKVETIASHQMSKGSAMPTVPDAYPYTIHVSSYRNKKKANRLAMELRQKGVPAFVCPTQVSGKGDYYRIFIGFYRTLEETRKTASKLRGQKDLHPLEAKMPYAVQVGKFDSDLERTKLEADLRSNAYLAYSIPDTADNRKANLLIGAYRTEEEAARLAKRLQQEGFKAKVVKR